MVARYCTKCGAAIGEQAKFCGACGTAVREASPPIESYTGPHAYMNAINQGSELPTINLRIEGGTAPVLRKGEVVHFAAETIAKEKKTISLGYQGGSRGISFPVPYVKGVRFRVGSHAGQVKKQEKIVNTSHGALIITNKRLFLHPAPGNPPINISLTKILSYQTYPDGLEVYKEGRQPGYLFALKDKDTVDTFAACLRYLTSR